MNIFSSEQDTDNLISPPTYYLPPDIANGESVVDAVTDVDGSASMNLLWAHSYNLKESYYFTRNAIVTTSITGTTSAISSAIIIYIICKSASKLSSSYHQIMFFMSFWDIILSTAMALTTIPMPADYMIYPFKGGFYGTKQTCRAQGALYLIGTGCVMHASIALNIYYLANIRYKVADDTVRKKALPAFFAFSTVSSILLISAYLWTDQVNPSPYDTFCTIFSYPSCEFVIDRASCLDAYVTNRAFRVLSALLIFAGLITLVVSMVMIIISVYQNEMVLITARKEATNKDLPADHQSHARIKELKITRSIGIQAFCYFIAFILSWAFSVVELARGIPSVGHPVGATNYVSVFRLIFQPLQGFFSAVIFVSHKVLICQRTQDMTLKESIWTIFSDPGSVPEILVSQVIIVAADDYDLTSRERFMELMSVEENSSKRDPSLKDGISYSEHYNRSSFQSSVSSGGDGGGLSHNSSKNDLSGFDLSSFGSGQKEYNEETSIPSLPNKMKTSSLSVISEGNASTGIQNDLSGFDLSTLGSEKKGCNEGISMHSSIPEDRNTPLQSGTEESGEKKTRWAMPW